MKMTVEVITTHPVFLSHVMFHTIGSYPSRPRREQRRLKTIIINLL